jgi:hypothetical protein
MSQAEWSNRAVAYSHRYEGIIIRLGFTMILLGYFLVWLPQPVAGLSFIGLEMGEWVKFIPEVRSGEVFPSRNFFYLPPILLGSMIAIWTAGWPNNRGQTWLARVLAVAVGFLALPAIESFSEESPGQWLPRVAMSGFVIIVVLVATYYSSRETMPATIPWLYFIILGMLGAILPVWTYLAIKPFVEILMGAGVGIGPGIWLNLLGNILLILLGISFLLRRARHEIG